MSADALRALEEELRVRTPRAPGDTRGTLARLTPERVVAAAAEIRSGLTVSLAAPVETRTGPDHPDPARHRTDARPHRRRGHRRRAALRAGPVCPG
ncbi:hypothetical protein ACFWSF_37485 [Streptomyces sp. NPDC058611]|uniref:hypothetical protein n=1 Tax=unclassified Streptomyces TaxID=2593676 RepID=UPI003665458E